MVKIIATIGPSSFSLKTIKNMKKNGMTHGRINTKYGDEKEWKNTLENLGKTKVKSIIDIKNLKYLDWVNKNKVDYVAIAFTDSASKINKVRKKLIDPNIKIISKIENQKGIDNLINIIKASGAIMVARGDLAKAVTIEKLPVAQKRIAKKCNESSTDVVIATEMLLSMTKNKLPTRAEAMDVANSIFDGADYLMLSEETTIGSYPALAVKMMRDISIETEKYIKELKKEFIK